MGATRIWGRGTGLTLPVVPEALEPGGPRPLETAEAGLVAPPGVEMRLEMLVAEGDRVRRGAPVARLRHSPEICLVAPMPGRVARIALRPGHRLGEIVLFADEAAPDAAAAGAESAVHPDAAAAARDPAALVALMAASGFWPRLRRRPFGGLPGLAERPAAIVVMATDTRPGAADPALALEGRAAALARGLAALAGLAAGPVFLCHAAGAPVPGGRPPAPVIAVAVGRRHPQGLAGMQVHALCPADAEHPVWDLAAEDVADLGDLIATGVLPQARLVALGGPGLRARRLVRCQPGADLRGLAQGALAPGVQAIAEGCALAPRPACWLGPRARQVHVRPEAAAGRGRNWFLDALTRSATARPVIPTAALAQAMGGAVPAMPLLRALDVGDDETAAGLGALSLLEEDLALVDYVIGGRPRPSAQLRAFLDRVAAETAP